MSEPIIWEKYDGFILSDIKDSMQEKVKELTIKHLVEDNMIFKLIKFKEEENFIEDHNVFLDHIFLDQSSLIIINKQKEEIVAAAIMKTMTKEMRSWTAIGLLSKNRKLNTLLTITRQMVLEADELLNYPTGSLHIFELCAPHGTENCAMDWMSVLFHGAYRVAQSLKMPLVTLIAFSQSEQVAAVAANFTEASRIFYPTYTETDGHRPIPPSDVGELYAVLYYKVVKPYVPHTDFP